MVSTTPHEPQKFVTLQFAYFYDGQEVFVWSWILAWTSLLLIWSLYEMRSILRGQVLGPVREGRRSRPPRVSRLRVK